MLPRLPPHCFLNIGSQCWKGELVACFVDDPKESWGQCAKRTFEGEVVGADYLLIRTLAAIYPNKRLPVYRLRYGNGFNTIVKVQWQEGGINCEAPLENAYVEAIVSVAPIPKSRQNLKYTEPETSVLSGLESMDSLNKGEIKCSMEWRLLDTDESPLRATAEKCKFITVVEAEDGEGVDEDCKIEQITQEEVNNLLTGMRCVNFPNAAVSEESKAKVENPLKRKSRVEAGPVEVDVSEVNDEKPAAKPAVASKRVKSNKKSQVGDPNKPKKPLTAYNLFGKDRREDIEKSNPGKNHNEINKLVGAAWKALADDEKKQYDVGAAAEQAEYKEAMKRYNNSKSD